MLVGLRSFFIQGRILKPAEDEIDDDEVESDNDIQVEKYHDNLAEKYHDDLVESYSDNQAESYEEQIDLYQAEYSKID
jgi:type III secretory pathway component EscR